MSEIKEEIITIDQPILQQLILEKPGFYRVVLAKPGAEVDIKVAWAATGKEHTTFSVVIHHQAPHTRAKTLMRGVAKDRAHLQFIGRIIIDPDCGDSNSFLTENMLLLSDHATAEAIPDLEILTDDVKCSHAATISQIPEEHLFYLMSRGLPQAEAEELIVEGFLNLVEKD